MGTSASPTALSGSAPSPAVSAVPASIASAHTPGPWRFHEYGNPIPRAIESPELGKWLHADYTIGRGRQIIGTVLYHRGEGGGYPTVNDEAEFAANAHLIVAAPELLEALIEAESLFAHTFAMDGTVHKKMRAAIAKARGEA